MGYLYLGLSVIGEVLGTNLLKASDGFSRIVFAVGSLVAYLFCFYFLSLSMRTMNMNVIYALWAGTGIVATTILSVFLWHEAISWTIVLGVVFITVGSVLLNLHIN